MAEAADKGKNPDGRILNLPPAAREAKSPASGQPDRPEEILVELWRRIRELREAGKRPERIIMSAENYRRVQAWHAVLGELSDPSKDYITKHTIFNLPVYIEQGALLEVRADFPP